ncbi:glycoside hydrolase family 2 TIM barrel-domain containing protein, partial [Pseudoflavonifractor phocaeensis]|uniref:glycoside hydrolase family 2 TIM barrel-domain containing protein n=1 Tax=Pseudoflavonifractor phocaeensis TaxID=1870988 RepID=UPI00195B18AB
MRKSSKRFLSTALALSMVAGLIVPANAATYQGAEVYDHVLDIYEEDFQDNVRFTDDGVANVTGQEWYADSETVGVNRERAKTQFVSYDSTEKALAAEKSVMDEVGPESSDYYMLLSGKDWDFAMVTNPEEAAKVDAEYLAEEYTGDAFQPEYVPQPWQTYRNEDGTFKYDEPMYSNQIFPWNEWEGLDYSNPKAPTVYNPVGYYRTTFTTPENWDGREIFISFQSVESAYYLYVNGKPVGYSTDSFTAHDFNITDYLNPNGEENTIALKIFRWSIGSWLENQDFIRESGIYRDVYLYSKDEVEIRDFFFNTEFDDRTDENSNVSVTVDTTLRGLYNAAEGQYTVSSYIVDDNGETVAAADDQTVTIAASAGKSAEEVLRDEGTTVTSEMYVENPAKWFPDTPNLYSLVLELKNSDGEVMESVVERVGFREIYKVDIDDAGHEQMQITGRQMILRGVNRHDTDLETGHALTYEDYYTDLTLMKQYNLNAIRTAHYPNDQVLYDLADELGIYVCAEANIESHAAASGGIKVPSGTGSGLPEWVPPVLDRVATNTERYKNHASVVIWSLGNEATYSQNTLNDDYSFWVASMYLLARDPSRLRKYERESDGYYGHRYVKAEGADPWTTDVRKNNIVDVQSTQYALPSGVAGYNGQMPYIHSEYNHAMGQAYGNAKEHWDVIREKDNVQGGFIWDYIDQSIRTVRDNGDGTYDEFWGYGGDWIDTKRNDNAFCGNGLVYADRTPSPKLEEAQKVHQQVNFYADTLNVTPGGTIDVKVVNEFEATNLDAFDITWTLTENSIDTLAFGTLALSTPHINGSSLDGDNTETVTIDIPADVAPMEGSDYLLTFSVKLKTATEWADVGYEIAYEQFELSFDDPTAQTEVVTDKDFTDVQTIGSEMILTGETDYGQAFEITLNTKLGTIVSYKLDGEVVMTAGPEQSYYRAETYNDTTVTKDSRLKNAGDPENMTNLSVSATRSGNTVVMAMSGTMAVPASALMAYVVYGNGEIVVLDQFIPSSNFASGGLPKIGSRMEISGDYDNLTYYGRGPQESYVDRKSGALVGVYTDTVYDPNDAMGEDSSWEGKKMLKPQDNDNRTDVRWTALTNDAGTGLMVTADDVVEISALHYTAEEMNSQTYNNAQYRHPNQVPQKDEIVWSIDLHQNGVSDTAFMGHRPLDGYRFATDRSYSYSYRISPIQLTDVSEMMDKGNEAFPVPASSYPITGIYINGNAVAGFDVDPSVVSTYTLSATETVDVTVDGTSDFEVAYNEDGTISVIAYNNYGQKFEYRVQLAREGTELPYTVFSGVKVDNNYSGQVAGNIIDGNSGTIWHSNWAVSTPMSTLWFMVELSEATDINGIRYLPRSDSNNFNGAYGDHDIYVNSKPISELTGDPNSGDWTYVGSGSWTKGNGWKSTALNEVVNAKSIMVMPKTTYGDTENAWGSCAEFRVTAASVVDTANMTVELDESYVYIGSPVCPDPVVTLDGMRLIRGVDYTVSYENNDVTSGTGTLTVNLCGSFSGEPVSKDFAITEGDQYTVTVENGTEESITAYVGQTVTVTAAEAAEGTMFDAWTSTDEAVTFADPSSESTTFVMPDHDVTVTATYVAAYNVTVVGGTLDEEGTITSQKYKVGSTITVYAQVPEGKVFDHWETDGEDAVIVDTARDPAIMNATPARDITITAVFKTDENYFEIVDELPSYAYLGQTFAAPETIKVIKGDQEIDAVVTWNEGQLNAINTATEVGAYTLSGSVEGHDITCTITVVPGDVVYFVDAGADEFTALGQAIVDYNGDTILNTTTDQAYTAESGWGYTNPESEVEGHSDYGTDTYSTIRNMTDSKGEDENDGRGKPLFYQFDNLEPGTYNVYIGYKNIWYQTNWQRNATIELISNDQVLATAEKNLNVEDGEYVALEAAMTDASGSLTVKLSPKENTNANNDMLVSYIVITRVEGEEPVPTPETYT